MKLKFLILYVSLYLFNIEIGMSTDLDCVQGVWGIRYDENSYESEYQVYKDHTCLGIYVYPSGKEFLVSYNTIGFFDEELSTYVDEKSLLESNTGTMFWYLESEKQESLSFNKRLDDALFHRVECSFCDSDDLSLSCKLFMRRLKLPAPLINYLIAYRKDDLKYFGIEYEDHDVCSVLSGKIIYDLNFKPIPGFDTSDVLLSIIGKKREYYKFEYESWEGEKIFGYVRKKDVELK